MRGNFAEGGAEDGDPKRETLTKVRSAVVYTAADAAPPLPAGRAAVRIRAVVTSVGAAAWRAHRWGAPGIADADHIDPRWMRPLHPSARVIWLF